ncbi:MAG TPA: thiamine phosphate synthase [Longimicrobiales bacterium]
MPAVDLRLIVITDKLMAAPRDVFDVVRQCLQAGAPAVQLRDKHASARELLGQAQVLRDITREYHALLFVNDRLDVALAARADGVHLGRDDVPVAAARAAVPEEFLIGTSVDDPAAAQIAQRAGASYIGCGAVFGTQSKAEAANEAIGVEQLQRVVDAVTLPVVAIGGITPQNVGSVAAAGAAGAAVISAVMRSENVAQTVRALLQPFKP